MTVRPVVNLNDLTREFFSATLSRAHGIRCDGKIGSFSWSEDDRVALPKVRVSKRETYEQEIEPTFRPPFESFEDCCHAGA
jgi:hypothetical protein